MECPGGGVTAHPTGTKESKGLSMRLTIGETSRRVVALSGPENTRITLDNKRGS